MPQHGAGFLARSYQHTERVVQWTDWLARRTEHAVQPQKIQPLTPELCVAQPACRAQVQPVMVAGRSRLAAGVVAGCALQPAQPACASDNSVDAKDARLQQF